VSGAPRKTILVIDDTPEDIAILSEELRADYRVLAATDHESAVRIARASPHPDLILLDILMPGVDGYQLCRALKADAATRGIPVIFVTVMGAAENEAAGFAAGCVDYIAKPVNPALVRARVRTHIELKEAREELERQNEVLRQNARLREEVEAINRHDLKNPLMIVMNTPALLLEAPNLTDSQRAILLMAEEAGRQMLAMINRTIDLYKMENGTYPLKPSPVAVAPLVRRVIGTLAKLMEDRSVACDLRLSGAASLMVQGEDLLVYTMLANLVKNAVEASPPGMRVTIELLNRGQAVISIHNHGAVPERIRGRYAQKFVTSGKEGGSGIGAYSARLIADTLGGSIGMETSEAGGTTVTVSLPMA
jgi:two-component system, sensor histidine kinase and response regulator